MKRNRRSNGRRNPRGRSTNGRRRGKPSQVAYIKRSHLQHLKDTERELQNINQSMLNHSNKEYMKLLEQQLEYKNSKIRNLEKMLGTESNAPEQSEETYFSTPMREYSRPQEVRNHLYPPEKKHFSPPRQHISPSYHHHPSPLTNPIYHQPMEDRSPPKSYSYSFFKGFGAPGGGAPLRSPISKAKIDQLREETLRESPHAGATRNYKRFKFELRSYEEQTKLIEKELKRKQFAESLRAQIEMKNKAKGERERKEELVRSIYESRENQNQSHGKRNPSPGQRYEETPIGPNFGVPRRRRISEKGMNGRFPKLQVSPSKSDLNGSSNPNFFPRDNEKMSLQRLQLKMEMEQHNVKKERTYGHVMTDFNQPTPNQKLSPQNSSIKRKKRIGMKKKKNSPQRKTSRPEVTNQRKRFKKFTKSTRSPKMKKRSSPGRNPRSKRQRQENEDGHYYNNNNYPIQEEKPSYLVDRQTSWKEDFLRLKDEIREEKEQIRDILNRVVKGVRMRRKGSEEEEEEEGYVLTRKKFEKNSKKDGLACKSYFVPIHPHGNLLNQIWKDDDSKKSGRKSSFYERKRFVKAK